MPDAKAVEPVAGIALSTVNIVAPDAGVLAAFYKELLGWHVASDEGDWILLKPPDGGIGLSFQTESPYVRPTWPAGPGDQHMMMHLEVRVDDLERAVAHALAAGAVLAEYQPQATVRVCLDPAGHPFCLWLAE